MIIFKVIGIAFLIFMIGVIPVAGGCWLVRIIILGFLSAISGKTIEELTKKK